MALRRYKLLFATFAVLCLTGCATDTACSEVSPCVKDSDHCVSYITTINECQNAYDKLYPDQTCTAVLTSGDNTWPNGGRTDNPPGCIIGDTDTGKCDVKFNNAAFYNPYKSARRRREGAQGQLLPCGSAEGSNYNCICDHWPTLNPVPAPTPKVCTNAKPYTQKQCSAKHQSPLEAYCCPQQIKEDGKCNNIKHRQPGQETKTCTDVGSETIWHEAGISVRSSAQLALAQHKCNTFQAICDEGLSIGCMPNNDKIRLPDRYKYNNTLYTFTEPFEAVLPTSNVIFYLKEDCPPSPTPAVVPVPAVAPSPVSYCVGPGMQCFTNPNALSTAFFTNYNSGTGDKGPLDCCSGYKCELMPLTLNPYYTVCKKSQTT